MNEESQKKLSATNHDKFKMENLFNIFDNQKIQGHVCGLHM